MNEMALFFFDGATGEMRGSAIAESFSISVDFLESSNSTFQISLNDANSLGADQNSVIFIPASELDQTPFSGRQTAACSSRRGLVFFAKNVTRTEKSFSITAKEALCLLEAQIHLDPASLAKAKISDIFAKEMNGAISSSPFKITYAQTGETDFPSPTWSEGIYTLLDLLQFACQTSGCAGLSISSFFGNGALNILMSMNWAKKASTLPSLSLESDFIGSYSIGGDSEEAPTRLTLAPQTGNSLGVASHDYYLHADGSIDENSEKSLMPEKRVIQLYSDDQYYKEGGNPDENLLAIAKGALAPTTEDKEISFALSQNSLYPLWSFGGLMKARLVGPKVSIQATLTKVALANSAVTATLTWGYQRSSLLSKLKKEAKKATPVSGGSPNADLSEVKKTIQDLGDTYETKSDADKAHQSLDKSLVGDFSNGVLSLFLRAKGEESATKAKKAPSSGFSVSTEKQEAPKAMAISLGSGTTSTGFTINDEKEEENTFSLGSGTTSTGFKLKLS